MKFIKKFLVGLVGVGILAVGLYVAACLVGGSSLSETIVFLSRFIAQPQSVGAVAPSSQRLAVGLSAYIQSSLIGTSRRLLEVGAGTGSVTQEIIKRLGDEDILDIVELDPQMAAGLREKYSHFSNITVFSGSITDWHPAYTYSYVVVGIPFNALPFSLVQQIWTHILQLVAPGGILSYFAYLGLPQLKKAFLSKQQKKDFKNIQRYLKQLYQQNGIGKLRVWSNVPPALVRYLKF
jgi:phospholipid N-methyltransferase